LLTVYILRDDGRFMAKCPELDLVTEMDTREEVLDGIVEMIEEYAEDYHSRIKEFSKSPNRAHHKPYVEMIIACKTKWDLLELISVKRGHLQLRPVT
jgi:predicted RNase H-like HicB family nuclease